MQEYKRSNRKNDKHLLILHKLVSTVWCEKVTSFGSANSLYDWILSSLIEIIKLFIKIIYILYSIP